MRIINITLTMLFYSCLLSGCATDGNGIVASGITNEEVRPSDTAADSSTNNTGQNRYLYNRKSRIADVMADPVFGNYGRLLFPVQRSYWSGETLEQLRLTYYNFKFRKFSTRHFTSI